MNKFDLRYGNLITATAEADGKFVRAPQNLCGNHNMSGSFSIEDTCSADGEYCYLTFQPAQNAGVTFNLGGVKKLGYMFVWNFNMPFVVGCGMRKVKISTSPDGKKFEEFKGAGYPYVFAKDDGTGKASNLDDGKNTPVDFAGLEAAYIRIVPDGGTGEGNYGLYIEGLNAYGLSKVRFYEAVEEELKDGELRAVPAREWDGEFSRMDGWTGADGIFIVPLDGVEARGGKKESLILFSDSFVSRCNPQTKIRATMDMVHNTMGLLKNEGNKKREIEFIVGKKDDGNFSDIIYAPKDEPYYYWLQDAVTLGDNVYVFTDCVMPDPSGPEGFQFKIVGVDLVKIPLKNKKPDFSRFTSRKTPLFNNGAFFGCSVTPNTKSSGLPNPDGYVYVYGVGHKKDFFKPLLVARVMEKDFENFDKYTFFDGGGWSSDITKAVPIAEDGSTECSVTPVSKGKYKGKYMYTHMQCGIGNTIAVSFADNLYGPFETDIPIYTAEEDKEFNVGDNRGVYLYNAKAHYHISDPDELLISYNINTMNFQTNMNNCDIYRPRFIRLKDV